MSINLNNQNAPQLDPEKRENLLKHFPEGVIALDLETTGLSPLIDKIIEISAIKITPAGIEIFDELINPQTPIPQITIDIHGITDQMVQDKPSIQKVFPKFQKFMTNLPLIAHNAKFDISFLMIEAHQQERSLKENKVYCSWLYAKSSLPKEKSFKLQNLATSLQIPLLNHHRALDDAIAALAIYESSINARLLQNKDPLIEKSMLFRLSDFDQKQEITIPKHLKLLEKNVMEQNILKMKYRGGSHKGVMRPIRPISLLFMPNGHILYAHCLLSDRYKSFALKKIKEVVEVPEEEKKIIQEKMNALKKPS